MNAGNQKERPVQPVKYISLRNTDAVAVVDDDDYEHLSQHVWRLHKDGYAYRQQWGGRQSDGKRQMLNFMMHRVIMKTPQGMDTDHINRDRLDNRRVNLRAVDRSQNNYNTGLWRNNTSGIKGVSWNSRTKSWRAYIGGGSANRIELGHFKSLSDAAAARKAAEAEIIECV